MRRALPELKDSPLGYAQAGRIFCGIELYEGKEMAEAIIAVCGDGVLMYQSDYPHPGCRFPDSPEVLFEWGLAPDSLRAILADNAARYLRIL